MATITFFSTHFWKRCSVFEKTLKGKKTSLNDLENVSQEVWGGEGYRL